MPTLARPRLFARQLLRVVFAPAVWLERAKGRRRLALLALYLLIASVPGAFAWRALNLRDLPDIGDPFDVEAFLASKRVPDGENAFVDYQRARGKLRYATGPTPNLPDALNLGWGAADTTTRAWFESNREALELWRRGTEKDRFCDERQEIALDLFDWLTRLETSRLEAQGDMAGAWVWHRALFRFTRHIDQGGVMVLRAQAARVRRHATGWAAAWATDDRTDARSLRRALGDLLQLHPDPAPLSDAYKSGYLVVIRRLADLPKEALNDARAAYLDGDAKAPWPYHLGPVREFRWFLLNEPERTRRIARFYFDDWLSQADIPAVLRPKPAPALSRADYAPTFHGTGPGRRAIRPEILAREYQAPGLAGFLIDDDSRYESMLGPDRAIRARLIVHMAEQLYLRERGGPPGDPEELIGPYLDRFPEGYPIMPPVARTDSQPR